MTIQDIQARISFYQEQQKIAQNNYSACAGAIEDCQYWIQLLTTEQSNNSAST